LKQGVLMRIEATKQRATATRVMRGKRFEHGRRRTSLTSVLLCLLTFAGVANAQQADSDRPIEPGGPSTGTPSIPGGGEQGWRGESIAPTADPSSICQMVESAAAAHGLPFEFFARVIWQESRFRSDAVGPVTRSGRQAQGSCCLQCRPGTRSRLACRKEDVAVGDAGLCPHRDGPAHGGVDEATGYTCKP